MTDGGAVPSLICSQTHPKDFCLGELEAVNFLSYFLPPAFVQKGTRVLSQCREGSERPRVPVGCWLSRNTF